jgi:hypothetical protein
MTAPKTNWSLICILSKKKKKKERKNYLQGRGRNFFKTPFS